MFEDDGWTLAILPDTQLYTLDFPAIFTAQTAFLRDNAQALNIRFMLHEGDVTQYNTEGHWQIARDNITMLDGVIPYALAMGNHDIGENGFAHDRFTRGDDPEFFPLSHFANWPTYGGAFEAGLLGNTYHLFSAGGVDYLVLVLEFGPRDEVLAWAGQLCDQYASRQVMIVTHAYLYDDGNRLRPGDDWNPKFYDISQLGSVNDGEDMWEKLVKLKPNIRWVFNGHQLSNGIARRVDRNDGNNAVFQIMANYQVRVMGGEGYLRLMRFSSDNARVQVRSYSPYLGTYLSDPTNDFWIDLTQGTYFP